jgi:hypothetical protein
MYDARHSSVLYNCCTCTAVVFQHQNLPALHDDCWYDGYFVLSLQLPVELYSINQSKKNFISIERAFRATLPLYSMKYTGKGSPFYTVRDCTVWYSIASSKVRTQHRSVPYSYIEQSGGHYYCTEFLESQPSDILYNHPKIQVFLRSER